jgi:hypothetical protein
MNTLKQLIVVPIIALMLGSASLMAQMTDSLSSSTTSSTSTTSANKLGNDGTTEKGSEYFWIAGVAFILVIAGVSFVVRSRRKGKDDPHLSGDSINNPASGI